MGQQIQPWRSADGSRLWLSMLVDTMERISRPELRAVPCDRSVIAAAKRNWRVRSAICRICTAPRISACETRFHSPAICSRGRLPRSMPRSLASSSRDVVARHRHHALALGELDLEIHHVLLAERHFRGRQIKFPHPRKALVIEPHRFFPPRHETLAPGFQRFGVMQPQDFDVAHQQPGALDRGTTSESAGM